MPAKAAARAAGPKARRTANVLAQTRVSGRSSGAGRVSAMRSALGASARSGAATRAASPIGPQRAANPAIARRTAANIAAARSNTGTKVAPSSGRRWKRGLAVGGAAFAGGAWASNSGSGSTKGSQNLYG